MNLFRRMADYTDSSMKLRSVELRNVGLTETDNDLPQSSMKLRSVELRNFDCAAGVVPAEIPQ